MWHAAEELIQMKSLYNDEGMDMPSIPISEDLITSTIL